MAISLNTVKHDERAKIDQQVKEYLEKGGSIKHIDYGIRADDPLNPKRTISLRGTPHDKV